MDETSTTEGTATFQRLAALAVLAFLAQVLWLAFAVGGHFVASVASTAFVVGFALQATTLFALAARRPQARLHRSSLLLAVACGSWAVGRVVLAVAGNGLHPDGEHRFGGLAPLGFLPFAIVALVTIATLPAGSAARARALLDGIIIGVALSFAAWMAELAGRYALVDGGSWQRLSVLGDTAGNIVMFTLGVTVFLSSRPKGRLSFVTMGLLAGGLFLVLVADVAAHAFDRAERAGTLLDLVWSLGFIGAGLAAAWPRPISRRRHPTHRRVVVGQVLPSLVAAGVLTVVLARVNRTGELDLMSEWLASCLVMCVLVRQVVTSIEEQRLKHLLEARVADRTAQLSKREQQFRALVQHSSDVIVIIRPDGRFDYVSPSVHHVLGHPPGALDEGSISQIVLAEDRPRVMALLAMATRRSGSTMTAEWRVLRADGTLRQVEVLVRNLTDEPAVSGIVLNLRDVTERKELEDQLTHQALHDDLTGLANRSLLRLRIEQALARWLFQNEPFTLVVVDVDDFKAINDSLGHVAGDTVLKTLAERIGPCTRRGDAIVRLDGDEFAVLLEGVAADDPEARHVAERIIEAVREPMRVEGRKLALRASIGLACVTDQVSQADDIMRNADLALHTAKSGNRGGFVMFEVSMHDQALRRVELETDLRRALERGELELYYQPTVDLQSGQMEGVEALLRWPHPEKGFISPVDFIPVAEESGLIVPIGTWVLRQACAEVKAWQDAYAGEERLTVNVNLSGMQLAQPDVVETVAEVLAATGLDPRSLVLEITESVLMDDKPATLAKMQALVDLGCQLAIDDFGTGYSSLSYLRKFPIGILKIDRSFVNGVGASGTDEETALVQAIVDLASTLQLRTVAEGIETAEQLAELRRMGCDVGQGYLLSRPVAVADVQRFIEATYAVGQPVEAAAPA